jgi:sugar lactone lactonase YvrE
MAFQEVVAGPRAQVAFSRPVAVAVAGDRVFIADPGLGMVHRLDLARRQYRAMRGSPDDPLRVPMGLAVGDGRLVVADRGRGAIDVFDLEGEWRWTQRWPEMAAPVAVAWDAEHRTFWLADAAAHACWATTDGRTLGRRIGEGGSAPGQFNFPTALACRPPTGLVVTDAMNFRVQLFDGDQSHGLQAVRSFGQKGDAAGDFSLPRGVAVDSEGHIYVVDSQFENVQLFDREGRLLMAFGESGGACGQFSLPSGIAIDERDRLWVADSGNHRVQVFQYLPEPKP